jgi:hypothetical protein
MAAAASALETKLEEQKMAAVCWNSDPCLLLR